MILEAIEENGNCRESDMMRFREAGPRQGVIAVRFYDRNPDGARYDVTGWSDQGAVSAFVQPVEDSGSGVSYLLYGGSCGLRFKPNDPDRPWSLDDPAQWGEPFLLLSDPGDVVSA